MSVARKDHKRGFLSRTAWFIGVSYVVTVVVATLWLKLWGDEGMIGVGLAYGPRWVLLLLGAPAIVAVLLARRWMTAGLVVAAGGVAFFWFYGFRVSGALSSSKPGDRVGLRVMQYNIHEADMNGSWLKELLDDYEPDVLTVQECRMPANYISPHPDYEYRCEYTVCVFSRLKILKMSGHDQTEAFARGGSAGAVILEVETEAGPVAIGSVHLETPRDAVEAILHDRLSSGPMVQENIEQRRWESELVKTFFEQTDLPLVVAGDFNMVVESAIYKRYWSDMTNAFSACGVGSGNSKFTRVYGARIDHVLYDDQFECHRAEVISYGDSDHLPVLVDLSVAN